GRKEAIKRHVLPENDKTAQQHDTRHLQGIREMGRSAIHANEEPGAPNNLGGLEDRQLIDEIHAPFCQRGTAMNLRGAYLDDRELQILPDPLREFAPCFASPILRAAAGFEVDNAEFFRKSKGIHGLFVLRLKVEIRLS